MKSFFALAIAIFVATIVASPIPSTAQPATDATLIDTDGRSGYNKVSEPTEPDGRSGYNTVPRDGRSGYNGIVGSLKIGARDGDNSIADTVETDGRSGYNGAPTGPADTKAGEGVEPNGRSGYNGPAE